MAMSPEFELIAKYFTRQAKRAKLGVGDDCALVSVSTDSELAISTDTLVSGTHFFPDVAPVSLGHMSLAVNLSDLAAMGALPRYVTLALTLPDIDEKWLTEFARGFFALADEYQVELIGGDTTRGPLSITITAFGEVAAGQALRRDGAKDGDDIWVSGELGGAALALKCIKGECALPEAAFESVALRLNRPVPRVDLGLALTGIATAAIDISDGLIGDLGHICERSGLSASIAWQNVPASIALLSVPFPLRLFCALYGGDDYELCFTAPQSMRARLLQLSNEISVSLARIGVMRRGMSRVSVYDEQGVEMSTPHSAFDHFANRA